MAGRFIIMALAYRRVNPAERDGKDRCVPESAGQRKEQE